jgi:hypothetical protein
MPYQKEANAAMRPALLFAATLALLAATQPASAQVYKCRAPSGKVEYRNLPCEGPAKTERVQSADKYPRVMPGGEREDIARQQCTFTALSRGEARTDCTGQRARNATYSRWTAEEAAAERARMIAAAVEAERRRVEAERRAEAERQAELAQRQAQNRAATATGCQVTTVFSSGFDNCGNRYMGSGGMISHRSDGKTCIRTGGMLQCN